MVISQNVKAIIKQYMAEIGRRGGKAGTGKAKARTTAQARKAANARWAKWALLHGQKGRP